MDPGEAEIETVAQDVLACGENVNETPVTLPLQFLALSLPLG